MRILNNPNLSRLTPIILMFFILQSRPCIGQKELKIDALNRYTIVRNDTAYEFYAVKPTVKIDYSENKKYYWYLKDTIIITQAAQGGKILHGSYKISFPDKNLKEAGAFRYGLKDGLWKHWYPNGSLKQIVQWRKGNMDGKITEFDELGIIVKKGQYKRNLFSGYIIKKATDGKTQKVIYKKGQVIDENKKNTG